MEIKRNDLFNVTITALSSDSSGVGRTNAGTPHENGKVAFIPFTAVGDEVEARAVKVTKSVIYGEIERILTPSPDRIKTDCTAAHRCGGCDFRHISYEAEIKAKEGFIRDAFTRIGGLTPEFLPIIPSENTDCYRNKVQYPVGKDAHGNMVYGFYAPKSNIIIPHTNCRLLPPVFGEIAEYIIGYINNSRISVYDELRHICIRKGHYSGEINLVLVARRKSPEFAKLAELIMLRFPAVKGVTLNINRYQSNVVFGDKDIRLIGKDDITDTMSIISGDARLRVKISPRSFYQVNTPAAGKLYGLVREFSQPKGKFILDLYCGIGTIGLSMASEARKIIGVEVVGSAVINARENAEINNIKNASFINSDSCNIKTALASDCHPAEDAVPDVIILDPARKGCDISVLESAAELAPERIIMVSCDPATAARDCGRLRELGYRTVSVGGVDLFPRTRHVECAALLSAAPKASQRNTQVAEVRTCVQYPKYGR